MARDRPATWLMDLDDLIRWRPHELIPLIAESIAATLSGRADLLLRIVLELTSAGPNTVAARHPALGRGTGSRPSSQN